MSTETSDSPDQHDWQSLFVGRERELNWLQDAWQDAQAGRPQLRVLRGESGLGKTKIVQEFFAWLSRPEVADPGNYWPERLLQGDNLRLNPDLTTQQLGDDMCYLWWGVRWLPPDARNQGELTHCAFFDQRTTLQPHWDRLSLYKDSAVAGLRLGEQIGSVAFELARDAALGLFPVLGLIKTAVDAGRTISAIGQASREFGEELAKHRKTPAEREQEELQQQVDQIVAFLSWVLRPFHRSGFGALPVVLILDDAQWMDERSIAVVRKLFDSARQHSWPLMVLATHWEREWHERIAAAMPTDADPESVADDQPGSFAVLCQDLLEQGDGACGLIDLEKLPDQESIALAAFPGLTPDQVTYLARRADGNPRLLYEILLYLQQEPALFEDEDLQAPLNEVAVEELESDMVRFDLHRLQERRYKRLALEIQELLAIASLQGVRFLADLIKETAGLLSLRDDDAYTDALERAVYPHAILFSDGQEREFRFAIFHEFAQQFVGRLAKRNRIPLEHFSEVLGRTAEQWIGSDRFDGLIDSEKDNLLDMALEQATEERARCSRVMLWAMDHYQRAGRFQLAAELADQWQVLAPSEVLPFNPSFSIFQVQRLRFYPAHIVFSITDYDCSAFPRQNYITDGERVRLLDGTTRPLQWAVASGLVRIDQDMVLEYLDFYLQQLIILPGSTAGLVESAQHGTTRQYATGVSTQIRDNYTPATVIHLPQRGLHQVNGLFTDGDSLFRAVFEVTETGSVTLLDQHRVPPSRSETHNPHPGAALALDLPGSEPHTAESSQTMASNALTVLSKSPETQPLVALVRDAGLTIHILLAPTEFAYRPRAGRDLFIGLVPGSDPSPARIVLLVADALWQQQLTLEGYPQPEISVPKDEYVDQTSKRMARKVAELCVTAYDLSLQKGLSEYGFIEELKAMGHAEAMEIFMSSL